MLLGEQADLLLEGQRVVPARLLRGALTLLAARGVPAALLTCDETNTASVATIRACGGVLRDRVEADLDGAPFPVPQLRFDVPTTAA